MNNQHAFSPKSRKIDPTKGSFSSKPDGSPDNPDRVEIGPTELAFNEWQALNLTPPNLDQMRRDRLERLCQILQRFDYGGALFYDPINIRYASDTTNMQLWTAHNPARALFVSADGYMVLFDFHGCEHLSAHIPLIDEVRGGAGYFYFLAGDKEEKLAQKFAVQIDELMQQHAGDNRRLAVDKIEITGLHALEQLGITIKSGQQVAEQSRYIKTPEEINAMRCAMASCDIAVGKMREQLKPGVTEVELWAELQYHNFIRGGEWIETRLLSSGPRTNPWFQEAGPRVLQNNELLGFDTDLIGVYGMCCDMSRTWFCGDGKPTDEQRELHHVAYDNIQHNMQLLKPGVQLSELTFKAKPLPEKYRQQRYSVIMHGAGLCDEFPSIFYPEDFIEGAYDYVLEPGVVLCVEAYVGAVGGKEGVKLEDQVLITETGFENLTRSPFDPLLSQ